MRTRNAESDPGAPPAVLNDLRVVAFAHIRRPVRLVKRTHLYVGGYEVKAVPRLAIAKPFRGRGVWLLHCTRRWHTIGAQSGYATIRQAKERAEGLYPGVSKAWQRSPYTAAEARAYRQEIWEGLICSFCGRLPVDFNSLVQGLHARICDICSKEVYETLRDGKA